MINSNIPLQSQGVNALGALANGQQAAMQKQQFDFEQNQREIAIAASIAYGADTPEKWAQAIDLARKQGIDVEDVPFEQRSMLMAQAQTIQEQIAGSRWEQSFAEQRRQADRAFGFQQQQAARSQGNADRAFNYQAGQDRASAAATAAAQGDFRAALGMSESGNNPNIRNAEGFTGTYQFGQDRLDDYNRANGTNYTTDTIRGNGSLQEQIQDWHESDILRNNQDVIGQTVNGVEITPAAAVAIAHLGGQPGLRRYVETGGLYDPADSNGTRLSDYHKKFAGTQLTNIQDAQGQDPGAQAQALRLVASNPSLPKSQRDYALNMAKQLESQGQQPDPLTLLGKLNADLEAKKITQEQHSARVAKLTKADGPLVTVNNESETAFSKEMGKSQAQMFNELIQDGMAIPQKLAQIDEMERLLQSAPSGAEAALKYVAGNFGIETEGLSDLQAAQALINQLVPAQRPRGSGPMSDKDLELFKQSLPRLINTREGNQTILQTLRGISVYQQEQARIAARVADGDLTPTQARAEFANLKNPLQVLRQDGPTIIGGYKIEVVD